MFSTSAYERRHGDAALEAMLAEYRRHPGGLEPALIREWERHHRVPDGDAAEELAVWRMRAASLMRELREGHPDVAGTERLIARLRDRMAGPLRTMEAGLAPADANGLARLRRNLVEIEDEWASARDAAEHGPVEVAARVPYADADGRRRYIDVDVVERSPAGWREVSCADGLEVGSLEWRKLARQMERWRRAAAQRGVSPPGAIPGETIAAGAGTASPLDETDVEIHSYVGDHRAGAFFFLPQPETWGVREMAIVAGVEDPCAEMPPGVPGAEIAIGDWGELRTVVVRRHDYPSHMCLEILFSHGDVYRLYDGVPVDRPLKVTEDPGIHVALRFLDGCLRLRPHVGYLTLDSVVAGTAYQEQVVYPLVRDRDAQGLAYEGGLLYLNREREAGLYGADVLNERDELPNEDGILLFGGRGRERWS